MNLVSLLGITKHPLPEETVSILHNESTFYNSFTHDLLNTKKEVIIESPFITIKRLNMLKPIFDILVNKGVDAYIMTRFPNENNLELEEQAEAGIRYFEALGVQVLICRGGHHRKLAMIDRKILWEGSLNILSQSNSREFMRRIESRILSEKLFKFLKFDTLNVFKRELNLL